MGICRGLSASRTRSIEKCKGLRSGCRQIGWEYSRLPASIVSRGRLAMERQEQFTRRFPSPTFRRIPQSHRQPIFSGRYVGSLEQVLKAPQYRQQDLLLCSLEVQSLLHLSSLGLQLFGPLPSLLWLRDLESSKDGGSMIRRSSDCTLDR